ncbi:MAG TPA: hypothetical protein VII56_12550 [Rhizomicrobium sp.]
MKTERAQIFGLSNLRDRFGILGDGMLDRPFYLGIRETRLRKGTQKGHTTVGRFTSGSFWAGFS